MSDIPQYGLGPAVEITENSEAYTLDNAGFTNPNLHRRTNIDSTDNISIEFGIYNVETYRTLWNNTYEPNSNTSEIP